MGISLKTVLLVGTLSLIGALSHKFYVSTLQIDYDEKSSELELIVQIFTDDLEQALEEEELASHPFTDRPPLGTVSPALQKYFNRHLKFFADNTPLELTFIGFQSDYDITKIYIAVGLPKNLKELKIQNTILIKQFREQKNLIHFKALGNRKSFLSNAQATKTTVAFPFAF